MQGRGRRSGAQLAPHAGPTRPPWPLLRGSPPRPAFRASPSGSRGSGASPGQPSQVPSGKGGCSPAGRRLMLPARLPPALLPERRVGGRRGRGHGRAGPAPRRPPGSASRVALSPGAPLGCRRVATCSGAESLLAARREGGRERAAAAPPAPGKLPLLPPLRGSCRRLPASEGISRRPALLRERRAPRGATVRSASASRSRRGQAG